MKHKLINSEKEFKKWAKTVCYSDECGNQKVDGEISHYLLSNPPEMYPAIVVYVFEKSFDRTGDITTEICDYVYLSEFTEGFNPNQREDDLKAFEKKLNPYFVLVDKWRDLEHSGALPDVIKAAAMEAWDIGEKLGADKYFEMKYSKNWKKAGR